MSINLINWTRLYRLISVWFTILIKDADQQLIFQQFFDVYTDKNDNLKLIYDLHLICWFKYSHILEYVYLWNSGR